MLAIEESRALSALIVAGASADMAARQLARIKPAASLDGRAYYDPAKIGRAAEFVAFIAARDAIEERQRAASDAWRAIPGVGSGAAGLTPDSVKFSAAYRAASAQYASATAALKALNGRNAKRFAKELAAEREARREARRTAA